MAQKFSLKNGAKILILKMVQNFKFKKMAWIKKRRRRKYPENKRKIYKWIVWKIDVEI